MVDDARYPNEIRQLRKNVFHLIKLKISPTLQQQRIRDLYRNNADSHLLLLEHPSEISADDIANDYYDLVIDVDNKDVKYKINQYLKVKTIA